MHRHSYKGKKLQREKGQRDSLKRGLIKGVLENGYVVTTKPKAQAIRSDVEKLITLGKKGTLHSRRLIISRLHDKNLAHKIVDELAPAYKERQGGYTRLEPYGTRRGDNADMAILSLVASENKAETDSKATSKPATAKPAAKKSATKPKVETKVKTTTSSKKKDDNKTKKEAK